MGGLNERKYLVLKIFGIILTFTIHECLSRPQDFVQRVSMFSGYDCKGNYTTYVKSNEPRLPTYLNDQIFSALVKGTWLFYDTENFNEDEDGEMEFIFKENECANSTLEGKISSIRFIGSEKDYRLDTITLFTGIYFQGQEEFSTTSRPSLNLDERAASFIITGNDPWTIYTSRNFTGNKACVYPKTEINFNPAFVFDTTIVDIPNQSIRSIKRGCFSDKVFRI